MTAEKDIDQQQEPRRPHRLGRYIGVGIATTAVDFVVCTILTRWVFRDNNLVGLAMAIASIIATIVAYILHSHITWRERQPAKYGVLKFFCWNFLVAIMIKPLLGWFFGIWTGLYELAAAILSWSPLDYDAVQYLGIYGLTTIVVMTLNFIFYDRLVFNERRG